MTILSTMIASERLVLHTSLFLYCSIMKKKTQNSHALFLFFAVLIIIKEKLTLILSEF